MIRPLWREWRCDHIWESSYVKMPFENRLTADDDGIHVHVREQRVKECTECGKTVYGGFRTKECRVIEYDRVEDK